MRVGTVQAAQDFLDSMFSVQTTRPSFRERRKELELVSDVSDISVTSRNAHVPQSVASKLKLGTSRRSVQDALLLPVALLRVAQVARSSLAKSVSCSANLHILSICHILH